MTDEELVPKDPYIMQYCLPVVRMQIFKGYFKCGISKLKQHAVIRVWIVITIK